MEHLQHFGLSDDPFRNELRQRDTFQTPSSKDALTRLERGVRLQRGLMLFTGDVGVGKSQVLRQLLESLEEEVFEACMVVVLDREADTHWLLTRFAKLLGVEEPAAERDAVLAQVYEQLAIVREEGRQTVLIVEGADALAESGALADVCALLKLEYEERRLFSLLLAGGPRLAEAVAADPDIAGRIELNVTMQPLDATAGNFYVHKRLEQAGGDTSVFDPAAVAAVCEAAGGRPGRINVVADNALFEAFLAGRRSVAAEDVARAFAQLGGSAAALPAAAAAPDATMMLGEELAGEGMFADGAMPTEGPPKDENEEDLVVALLEEV